MTTNETGIPGEPIAGPPLEPVTEPCAHCGGSLPQHVYGIHGRAGLWCSDVCLAAALTAASPEETI